tara:strand:+ start:702 stop:1118 length:417 start_codon:yes stop_codon:yes gene_type:complete
MHALIFRIMLNELRKNKKNEFWPNDPKQRQHPKLMKNASQVFLQGNFFTQISDFPSIFGSQPRLKVSLVSILDASARAGSILDKTITSCPYGRIPIIWQARWQSSTLIAGSRPPGDSCLTSQEDERGIEEYRNISYCI